MANNPSRIGFLGLGGMGRRHAENVMKHSSAEIAAFCAIPITNAQRFNQEHHTHYPVYDDFQTMLKEVAMDALVVSLPPYAHCGQIEAAAKKGIHIFAEKPLALELERGESIVRAIEENGVLSQMGYHMRFGGAVKKLMALVENCEVGRPTLFSGMYECNSLHSPWWRDVKKSGGQIFEQVIHLYDMALYTMGKAQAVSGFSGNLCHKENTSYTVEDTSATAIRFTSGAMGSILGSNCSIPGRWDGQFKIVFEHLVADFKDFNHAVFTHTKGEPFQEVLSYDIDAYADEMNYFISVLHRKKPEFAPIAQGLEGLRLVSMAVFSAAQGGMLTRL